MVLTTGPNSYALYIRQYSKKIRTEKRNVYLKVVASILPKDLNVNFNPADSMTDEQLIERIRSLDAAIRPFLDAEGEGGAGGSTGLATAH